MMCPFFARVMWYDDYKKENVKDDIWGFANNYAGAAEKIENNYRDSLVGFSIYLFECDDFIHEDDRYDMEMEAKRTLGIY